MRNVAFLWVWLAGFVTSMPAMDAGLARIDITPSYPVRLSGYGNRTTNSEGVAQRIWAKALALGTGSNAAVLVTVDNCGLSAAATDEVASRLRSRFHLPRERIAFSFSHTHSAPMVTGVLENLFASDIAPGELAVTERYTRELIRHLEKVVDDAMNDRRPAHVTWTEGRVGFAKNRRAVRATTAQSAGSAAGPVDHSLPLMVISDLDGGVRGLWASYACHCTTLAGGKFNQIHGDWAGCAQAEMERNFPGAVSLMSIGCGADANPFPRGSLENAETHGKALATEVKRIARKVRAELKELPACGLERITLDFNPLPTRAEWEKRAQQPGIVGYHARKNLARLDRGETLPTTLPYIVQAWSFGSDLAIVFLAGEVVVDYELRLKRELDARRIWVNGYANDVPCYIPSVRILTEGGYEAEDSLWYYDRPARLSTSSEDRIIKAVHRLVPREFQRESLNR